MTTEKYKQGHAPCHCGEFTHIFRQCAMQRLPTGYSGELCPRCNLWMCKTEKLTAHDDAMPKQKPLSRAGG
jgi:hypothetical protein